MPTFPDGKNRFSKTSNLQKLSNRFRFYNETDPYNVADIFKDYFFFRGLGASPTDIATRVFKVNLFQNILVWQTTYFFLFFSVGFTSKCGRCCPSSQLSTSDWQHRKGVRGHNIWQQSGKRVSLWESVRSLELATSFISVGLAAKMETSSSWFQLSLKNLWSGSWARLTFTLSSSPDSTICPNQGDGDNIACTPNITWSWFDIQEWKGCKDLAPPKADQMVRQERCNFTSKAWEHPGRICGKTRNKATLM